MSDNNSNEEVSIQKYRSKISSFLGTIDAINKLCEGLLTDDEYKSHCDSSAEVASDLRLVLKRLNDKENDKSRKV